MAQVASCTSIVSDGTSVRCQRLAVCKRFSSGGLSRHAFHKQGPQRAQTVSIYGSIRAAALPDLEKRLSRYEWDEMKLPDLTGDARFRNVLGHSLVVDYQSSFFRI